MKDMRSRCDRRYNKWAFLNRFAYLWALQLAKKEDRQKDWWCGVRFVCRRHDVKECMTCFKDDKPMVALPVCVNDKRYVLMGISHGNNSKFSSDRTVQRR